MHNRRDANYIEALPDHLTSVILKYETENRSRRTANWDLYCSYSIQNSNDRPTNGKTAPRHALTDPLYH